VEAVIFVGVQASGKSSFYQERFANTHMRINLDMLKTRHREQQFLEACLRTRQPLVIDNTNPTILERQVYVQTAKAAQFRVVGYYFRSSIEECKSRNEQRSSAQKVPLNGLLGTYGRLELPRLDEGFDALFYVTLSVSGFAVEEWRNEV